MENSDHEIVTQFLKFPDKRGLDSIEEYFHIWNSSECRLDGTFTADQLRQIADAMECPGDGHACSREPKHD